MDSQKLGFPYAHIVLESYAMKQTKHTRFAQYRSPMCVTYVTFVCIEEGTHCDGENAGAQVACHVSL